MGKIMTLTLFEFYTVHLKNLGQFFFDNYSITCLKKDTNIWNI